MSRPRRGGASYASVLALPHARGLFAAALLPRLCYGLLGIPLLIDLKNVTGSYALAGAAVSLFGLAVALLGPARARLVQRHHAALPWLAVAYTLSLTALAVATATGAPRVIAAGLAVLAGLCPPPVGPLMRAFWSNLAPNETFLQRALSLDTAAESTVFALGPVLGGMLTAAFTAPAVLALCAALALTGILLLARAARGQWPKGHEAVAGDRRAGPFGMRKFMVLIWAVAAAVAAADVAAVAAWGALATGVVLALFSAGGVLGGLAYGRRDWRVPLGTRPLVLAACSAACYGVIALAFAPVMAGAGLLVAGACADILLVTTYQLVDVKVTAERRAEAGAWLNTAYNLGAAMGAAGGGVLVTHGGPRLTWVVIATVTAACAIGGALGPRGSVALSGVLGSEGRRQRPGAGVPEPERRVRRRGGQPGPVRGEGDCLDGAGAPGERAAESGVAG